jgi:hypothetical protein
MGTPLKAEPFLFGDKLYQQRAVKALPILVRQAHHEQPISYSDLAHEIGMPNPRNLNYVLGSIGQAIKYVKNKWNEDVPLINFLVVNKGSHLPGEGIEEFIPKTGYKALSPKSREELYRYSCLDIFTYPKWDRVLHELNLQPLVNDFSPLIKKATSYSHGAGGEGQKHKQLKEYIANNPKIIGLDAKFGIGETERPLPSGDSLDVSFFRGKHNCKWVAAEAKSSISDADDISRGIFQCIKYKAVMEAELILQEIKAEVRTILVLESKLTPKLTEMKNTLGVEVIEGIVPK